MKTNIFLLIGIAVSGAIVLPIIHLVVFITFLILPFYQKFRRRQKLAMAELRVRYKCFPKPLW